MINKMYIFIFSRFLIGVVEHPSKLLRHLKCLLGNNVPLGALEETAGEEVEEEVEAIFLRVTTDKIIHQVKISLLAILVAITLVDNRVMVVPDRHIVVVLVPLTEIDAVLIVLVVMGLVMISQLHKVIVPEVTAVEIIINQAQEAIVVGIMIINQVRRCPLLEVTRI